MHLDALCILGEPCYEKSYDISTTLPPESRTQTVVAPPRLRSYLQRTIPMVTVLALGLLCSHIAHCSRLPATLRTEVPGRSRKARILQDPQKCHPRPWCGLGGPQGKAQMLLSFVDSFPQGSGSAAVSWKEEPTQTHHPQSPDLPEEPGSSGAVS